MGNLFQNEQEAISTLLYSVAVVDANLTVHENKKIANTLAYCSKFAGLDLSPLVAKAFSIIRKTAITTIMDEAVLFISDHFKPTLYAMVCDLLSFDGNINDADVSILSFLSIKLGLSDTEKNAIDKSFKTRYAYNYNIE